jgi:hypothetical protein
MAHAMADPNSQYNRHQREMKRIRDWIVVRFWIGWGIFFTIGFVLLTWFPFEPLTLLEKMLGQFVCSIGLFFGLFKLSSALIGQPEETPQEVYLDDDD